MGVSQGSGIPYLVALLEGCNFGLYTPTLTQLASIWESSKSKGGN